MSKGYGGANRLGFFFNGVEKVSPVLLDDQCRWRFAGPSQLWHTSQASIGKITPISLALSDGIRDKTNCPEYQKSGIRNQGVVFPSSLEPQAAAAGWYGLCAPVD
jgi:hypothetical protein